MAECLNCEIEMQSGQSLTQFTHRTLGITYGPFCSDGCRNKHKIKIVENY